jgi:pyrimidine deaminase RibD-like protein
MPTAPKCCRASNLEADPQDQAMMRRAITLAQRHLGRTGSNPSVGCIIVREDQVIGEGVTGLGGHPHAEELALVMAGVQARGATAFVTLEPCARRSGGGGSCSERLGAAGVARVVIACSDGSIFASGKGAAQLVQAGIDVQIGVLAEEASHLYADYEPATDPKV